MNISDEVLKYRKIAQYIALLFGVTLVFGETLRNWGDWPGWKSYAFDYLFAILLVLAGLGIRRTRYVALSVSVVIWALVIFLFSWSFFGHLKRIHEPTYGLISQAPLTMIIGALDLVAVVGLFYTTIAIYKTWQDKRDVI
jgi:hypothetical protein